MKDVCCIYFNLKQRQFCPACGYREKDEFMQIEVTSTSVSKKGTIWMQVKLIEGTTPRTGEVFDCTYVQADESEPTHYDLAETMGRTE